MKRKKPLLLAAPVCFALAAVAVCLLIRMRARQPYAPPPVAFEGDSSKLQSSVVVPTLDTPLPEGRNAVWCASFEMAWRALSRDLPEGGHYSTAGVVGDGIAAKIRDEMAERFPGVPPPDLEGLPPDWIVAYAYLAASAKFTIPFFENSSSLAFTDSERGRSSVGSFGIRSEDDYAYYDLRDQVKVIHCSEERTSEGLIPREFAVDPGRDSSPNQVLLARIDRKATLAETLAALGKKAADSTADPDSRKFRDSDVLLVPNAHFRIDHRFGELEQKALLNAGFESYPIVRAAQRIDFRLDRAGARLESKAEIYVGGGWGPRHFIFDRPFLVIMKKRGAERPFLVIWVDNAELLSKPR
ncbi:MAG: hypothetical protein ACYS9X_07755 [Planctomycetota bacterium]